jgi:RNA polymerase sigma-70 factor (ECF subfamily)
MRDNSRPIAIPWLGGSLTHFSMMAGGMEDTTPIALDGPVGEMTDEALLRGLRERDAQACSELCQRFAPKLHRFAAARLGWASGPAEDIAIQALADAVRNIRQYDPRKSTLGVWLYGIARRQIVGEARRQRRLKSVPAGAQVSLASVGEAAAQDNPVARVLRRLDAQRQVAQVAAILSDIEYEVLVLSCIDQLSAREIGQVVRRSERAVHSLLHRAKQKARERLTRDEER